MKLSDIKYERPNIDELRARAEELFKRFDEAQTADEQLAVYNEYIAMSESISTQSSLAYIRFTLDTRDEFYSKEIDWMNETRPVLSEMSLNFRKKMLASKFRPELEKALSTKNFSLPQKSRSWAANTISPSSVNSKKDPTERSEDRLSALRANG